MIDAYSDACFLPISFSWTLYNHIPTLSPPHPPRPRRMPFRSPNSLTFEWLALWGSAALTMKPVFPNPLEKAEATTWQTPGQSPLLDSWYFVWSIHDGKKWVGQHLKQDFFLKIRSTEYWEPPFWIWGSNSLWELSRCCLLKWGRDSPCISIPLG